MKVAFDNQIFFAQKYGGISNYFFNLALQLNKQGISAQVFASTYINRYFQDHPELIQGRFVSDFPPFSKKMMRYSSRIVNSLRVNAWKPDILHQTYFNCDLLFIPKVPRVITVYDFIAEFFFPEDKVVLQKKKAIKEADCIICISHSTRNDLLKFYPEAEPKTQVVYLGGGGDRLQLPDLSNNVPNEPYLLYVGNRDGYKNFSGFIKAYAASAFIRNNFCIVAFGGQGFSNEERVLFREVGLDQQRIYHIGGNNTILINLYQRAALFVYPSLYEGFGIPPLEAFAYGCPVAASNVSSMPEVCGDGCQYFDPYRPESIAEAIEQVLQDTQLRDQLIVRGHLRSQKFTWQQCADQTSKLYRDLL